MWGPELVTKHRANEAATWPHLYCAFGLENPQSEIRDPKSIRSDSVQPDAANRAKLGWSWSWTARSATGRGARAMRASTASFFIAVTSTRIYCRPICPARSPKDENVRYYATAAAAEAAGFRPCLRCRPEASPGTPAWSGTSSVVSRALRLIGEGALDRRGRRDACRSSRRDRRGTCGGCSCSTSARRRSRSR